jgi:hypothetical protein
MDFTLETLNGVLSGGTMVEAHFTYKPRYSRYNHDDYRFHEVAKFSTIIVDAEAEFSLSSYIIEDMLIDGDGILNIYGKIE